MMEDVLLSFSIKKTCSLDMSLDLASKVLNLINNRIGYVISLTFASNKAYGFQSNTPQSIQLQFALRAQW